MSTFIVIRHRIYLSMHNHLMSRHKKEVFHRHFAHFSKHQNAVIGNKKRMMVELLKDLLNHIVNVKSLLIF